MNTEKIIKEYALPKRKEDKWNGEIVVGVNKEEGYTYNTCYFDNDRNTLIFLLRLKHTKLELLCIKHDNEKYIDIPKEVLDFLNIKIHARLQDNEKMDIQSFPILDNNGIQHIEDTLNSMNEESLRIAGK